MFSAHNAFLFFQCRHFVNPVQSSYYSVAVAASTCKVVVCSGTKAPVELQRRKKSICVFVSLAAVFCCAMADVGQKRPLSVTESILEDVKAVLVGADGTITPKSFAKVRISSYRMLRMSIAAGRQVSCTGFSKKQYGPWTGHQG